MYELLELFETLDERMKRKLDNYNGEICDDYSDFVIYLTSDEILKKLKINNLETIIRVNNNIKDVGNALKTKYGFDEVYCFNNEISLIYKYENQKADNKELMYNGNKNKILTKLASEASCIFTRMMNETDNFMFKGRYVKFYNDGDVENWKKWRENNCERNIVNYLYRLVISTNVHGKKNSEMITELNKYGILEQTEIKMLLNKTEDDE